MKKILKWTLRIVGVLLIIVGVFVALNWTMLKRGLTYPGENEITAADWYTPKAEVTGNFSTPLPTADSLTIAKTALNDIAEYAGSRNSSALLIMHKDKIVLEKYWNEANDKTTTNSMSMAKTLIGLLIGVAIEDGKIASENEPAATYLTEWKNDDRSKITIKDLLLMQSGLVNDDDTKDYNSDLVKMYAGTKVEKVALKIPARIPPATKFEYNNANTQLLAIILERVTGQSIEDYLSEKIWQPIGANSAGWWMDRKKGMPKAFCCFFASARDWMRVGRLVYHKGNWNGKQLVSAAWIEKMIQQSPLEKDYGYHLWLGYEDDGWRSRNRKAPYLVNDLIGIDGASKQHVFIMPSKELILVRTGERPKEWDESYMVNVLVEEIDKKRGQF